MNVGFSPRGTIFPNPSQNIQISTSLLAVAVRRHPRIRRRLKTECSNYDLNHRSPFRHSNPPLTSKCAPPWPQPKSATTSTVKTPPSISSNAAPPKPLPAKPHSLCPQAPWATRSPSASSPSPARRSSPNPAPTFSIGRWPPPPSSPAAWSAPFPPSAASSPGGTSSRPSTRVEPSAPLPGSSRSKTPPTSPAGAARRSRLGRDLGRRKRAQAAHPS